MGVYRDNFAGVFCHCLSGCADRGLSLSFSFCIGSAVKMFENKGPHFLETASMRNTAEKIMIVLNKCRKSIHLHKLRSMVARLNNAFKYLSPVQRRQWTKEWKVDDSSLIVKICRFGAMLGKIKSDR